MIEVEIRWDLSLVLNDRRQLERNARSLSAEVDDEGWRYSVALRCVRVVFVDVYPSAFKQTAIGNMVIGQQLTVCNCNNTK